MPGEVGSGEDFRIAGCGPIKRDAAGQRRIIKENSDTTAIMQIDNIWLSWIDSRCGLPGGEHRIGDTILRQQIQGLDVYRSFRQPHSVGGVTIAVIEILKPPGDLCALIAWGCERQNGMVVCL